jgi:hypothetical protein
MLRKLEFFKVSMNDELMRSIQYFDCFSKRKESFSCNFLLVTFFCTNAKK